MISSFFPSSKPVCNRCGRCCFYEKDGVMKKCKNLVFHSYNPPITSCRIWNSPTRLTVPIDEGVFCATMDEHAFTYRGCPYNRDKPVRLLQIRPYRD